MVRYHPAPFIVAAVQAGPVVKDAPKWFDLDATLDKAIGLIREAGKQGVRLIVFPECWLPCYPYWSLDLADRPAFRDLWAHFLWSSLEVPGRESRALCDAAKEANAYVVMGINERDRDFRGRMYNSILYISSEGEIMGTHRKICTTVQERFFHTPGDGGDNLKTVFKTGIGSIGGSICGEHTQLTLIHTWIMQGIQIHCSLWPGNAGLETITDIQTRATSFAAGAFGVLAATYMSKEDCPPNFYSNSLFNTPEGFRGGSGVVNPFGQYIAGPIYDEESIVCAEIDLSDTDRSRDAVNLTGIYSRWDLLSINTQQKPYEPLVPVGASEKPMSSQELSRMDELEARVRELDQQLAAMRRARHGEVSEEE